METTIFFVVCVSCPSTIVLTASLQIRDLLIEGKALVGWSWYLSQMFQLPSHLLVFACVPTRLPQTVYNVNTSMKQSKQTAFQVSFENQQYIIWRSMESNSRQRYRVTRTVQRRFVTNVCLHVPSSSHNIINLKTMVMTTLSLLYPLVRSPQSAVFVLHWPYLYLLWAICIWCERFVFVVNDS